jgi:hypothetical protein
VTRRMASVGSSIWESGTFSTRTSPAPYSPVEEIRPGDVVWFAPGEKHWHGASPTTAMSHIAIQEKRNGSPVDWMEHVSDEQYRR